MTTPFFDRPILNSPYHYPGRHCELDDAGQPTQQIIENRRKATFVTPVPRARGQQVQQGLQLDDDTGLSDEFDQYELYSSINSIRQEVDIWRNLPQSSWHITPETAPLLDFWRNHSGPVHPLVCQVEAFETAIWMMEVALQRPIGKLVLERVARSNEAANPRLRRLALKQATGVDADGNANDRSDTVSVFSGPAPQVLFLDDERVEQDAVATWMKARIADGVLPHEFGVFVRSEAELARATAAVTASGIAHKVLDEHMETATGHVAVSTMHLAKGFEFRAVVVMACDEDILPLAARIEQAGDKADLEEVYEAERHLLYVACTRARDFLLVTAVEPGSEFLQDLGA